MSTDSDESRNDWLFIAENNYTENTTTISRIYVMTNYSDQGYLSEKYFAPSINLDFT